jgi:hypothetical protein
MSPQEQRRAAERDILEKLQASSSIFRFQADGSTPDGYRIQFYGKGLCRQPGAVGRVETLDRHEWELKLPSTYPETPPVMRWGTPVFHPNISFAGFLEPVGVGIHWLPVLTLDVICERLWDLVRCAYVDLENPVNRAAADWFLRQREFQLPIDDRPLRDLAQARSTNVFRYHRKETTTTRFERAAGNEVYYIGDVLPAPALARPLISPEPGGNDILYIGDDEMPG